MKSYEECKKEVAKKYGFSKLVMGHLVKYFDEAAEMYADQFRQSIVVGNEDAVAFAEWIDGCIYNRMTDKVGENFEYVGWTDGNETIAETTEELFEIFKNNKSSKTI